MSDHTSHQYPDIPVWMSVPSQPVIGAVPRQSTPLGQGSQTQANIPSSIASFEPGTAQFVFTKLGRYGLGCLHQDKAYDPNLHDHQYPRRMGFFHTAMSQDDELRISFLKTERFCLSCLDDLIPGKKFNYWSVAAGAAPLQKRWAATSQLRAELPTSLRGWDRRVFIVVVISSS